MGLLYLLMLMVIWYYGIRFLSVGRSFLFLLLSSYRFLVAQFHFIYLHLSGLVFSPEFISPNFTACEYFFIAVHWKCTKLYYKLSRLVSKTDFFCYNDSSISPSVHMSMHVITPFCQIRIYVHLHNVLLFSPLNDIIGELLENDRL